MAVDKKFFVDINLQGNALNNATIGTNSDMTKGGSFRFDGSRLEYYDGSSTQLVANLDDISAVTGGLILQTGYDAATNTPDIADGSALKGYFWVVTTAGSFLGESVQVGDSIIAKVDNAGASIGDWLILQGNVVIATDSVDGIVRLATQAEVDAGTEGGAVVLTPATFQNSGQIQGLSNSVDALESDKLARDGSQAMTGNLDMDTNSITNVGGIDLVNGNTVTNVPAPTNSTDAANKQYVDDAQAAAETYADGVALTAENNAKAYADSLAPNYDPAGSAATAESNANTYTDGAISQEVTDRNAAIATAKGEAIADANSYTDGEIAQEVIDRDAAIATAKSEAIADANAYTDAGLATKLDLAGGTMSGGIDMGGNDISNVTDIAIASLSGIAGQDISLQNNINANNNTITSLVDPTNSQDAATKNYVDTQIVNSVFSGTFANTDWTLGEDGVYGIGILHNLSCEAPKVSVYVSGILAEFSVIISDSNTIGLKSNIAPPASITVGVSR